MTILSKVQCKNKNRTPFSVKFPRLSRPSTICFLKHVNWRNLYFSTILLNGKMRHIVRWHFTPVQNSYHCNKNFIADKKIFCISSSSTFFLMFNQIFVFSRFTVTIYFADKKRIILWNTSIIQMFRKWRLR